MSQQIRRPKADRCSLSTRAAVLAATILMTAPSWSNAVEPAQEGAKTPPCESMDHSKMDGMKCAKGADGAKETGCMSMTGDVDYDFAANMRKHHQMGVDMSQAELKKGTDPKMIEMANAIIAAQQKEIDVLDQWLAAHKESANSAPK